MTEYDYSPGALEAHMAKQASIAQWSAKLSQQRHEFTNPFKLSPEELARAKECEFYQNGEKYEGPDRPPTPTGAPSQAAYYGYENGGTQYQQQQLPANTPTTSRVLVPRWNGSTWVYEVQTTNLYTGKKSKTSGNSVRSGKSSSSSKVKGSGETARPVPVRSHTMPAFYSPPPVPGGPQRQQSYVYQPHPLGMGDYQQQPVSAGTSLGSGSYTGYAYPTVILDGAKKKTGSKLRKKDKDGVSLFGRL